MINIINRSLGESGVSVVFLTSCVVTWGLRFMKRHPVYTLIQHLKLYIKITWGLGRIRIIATPLDRRKATRKIAWGLGCIRTIATPLEIGSRPKENYLGAKESVAKAQLKHRHPLSTAQNIAWGFFASQ